MLFVFWGVVQHKKINWNETHLVCGVGIIFQWIYEKIWYLENQNYFIVFISVNSCWFNYKGHLNVHSHASQLSNTENYKRKCTNKVTYINSTN